MTEPTYQPLGREQVAALLAPGAEDAKDAWSRLTGALHALMKMSSVTYPRPLYFDEAADRQSLVDVPERLRGTTFHAAAVRNVRAAADIETLFRERGHTDEVHEIVDAYIAALLGEYDAIRLFPNLPPVRGTAMDDGPVEQRRHVAGGR